VHGGGRVLHALPSVSATGIVDIVCGVWNTAHRSSIVVATFPRPSPRFMSTTRRTTPPPERPTTPPSLGSPFDPLEYLYVNKLPLVAALLARTVPGTLERIAADFMLALCMRRTGKTSIILLMKYAATGDRSALRWLLDDPAVKVFMEKPGPNGFQLFTTTLPVIHLDFSSADYGADDGRQAMVELLRRAGRELGVRVKSADDKPVTALKNLVAQVRKKYVTPVTVDEAAVQDAVSSGGVDSGVAVVPSRRVVPKRIVLLIDEYDKPIQHALGKSNLSAEERKRLVNDRVEAMSDFYSTLKSLGPCFHLVFVTGITKASGVSLFSAANNFVSLFDEHPEFAGTLFCLTEAEIKKTYGSHIDSAYADHPLVKNAAARGVAVADGDSVVRTVVLDRMRDLFNGYLLHPRGTPVFNTVSVLASLQQKGFVFGWTSTGSPASHEVLVSLAVDLTPEELYELLSDSYTTTWSALMKPVSVTQLQSDAVQVAFQAGLVTIKSATQVLPAENDGVNDWDVTLGAPNREVRKFLNDCSAAMRRCTESRSTPSRGHS
jgi:hypothetical protein